MSGISLDRVRATATSDLGFDADLLYASPLKLDASATESAGFRLRTVRGNLEKASGVASVTVADGLPLGFSGRSTKVSLPADANVAPTYVSVHVTRVGDGYLNTMGIPLVRGRGFTVDDGAGADMVTVISKPLADRLFPNADAAEALGKRLTFGAADAEDKRPQSEGGPPFDVSYGPSGLPSQLHANRGGQTSKHRHVARVRACRESANDLSTFSEATPSRRDTTSAFAPVRTLRISQLNGFNFSTGRSTSPLAPLALSRRGHGLSSVFTS